MDAKKGKGKGKEAKETKSAKASNEVAGERHVAEAEEAAVRILNLQTRVSELEKNFHDLDLHVKLEFDSLKKEVNEAKQFRSRDRGPKSTRDMTEDDAMRVISGDLEKVTIKKAAAILGLSYGQVYSAKNGYTFKGLYGKKN